MSRMKTVGTILAIIVAVGIAYITLFQLRWHAIPSVIVATLAFAIIYAITNILSYWAT